MQAKKGTKEQKENACSGWKVANGIAGKAEPVAPVSETREAQGSHRQSERGFCSTQASDFSGEKGNWPARVTSHTSAGKKGLLD